MVRAKNAGLAQHDDREVIAYAVAKSLVVVTADRDMSRLAGSDGCQVVHIQGLETTARTRLAAVYTQMVEAIGAGELLFRVQSGTRPRGRRQGRGRSGKTTSRGAA